MPRLRLTRSNARIFASSMLVVGVLVLCTLPLAAQDSASPEPTVRQAVGFGVSPPLRDLAKLPRAPQYGVHEALPVRRIPKRDFGIAVDPVEQNTARPSTNFATGLNLLGVGNGFPGYTVPDAPPDTNMAVGDTQILQWVNVSFAVFNKFNGAVLAGPIEGNLLFSALGGPCATSNSGDIIAQWDNAAHQWFLAQNVFSGPPYYACVAVSTTADALGTYYLYQFPLGNNFPDYPKWGRWNTSWAQTMNNFGGSGFIGPEVCVYERARLLAGSPPPRQVCFQLHIGSQCISQRIGCQDSLLPADIDSPTNPPAAEDQFFIGSVADVSTHQLSLYSVHIDWLHPHLAYITGDNNSQLTTVPTYTGPCSGTFGGACVPQKGVSDQLDSLGDRLMYRFAYYNDAAPAGKQHWYVNHSVGATGGQIGVRWYEFQAPKIAITPPYFTSGTLPFQAGTYAPDSNYRWMGSIAADINNDILAGYSESSSSMYPSIAVAGRLKSDPPSTLDSEVAVVAGTGSQPDTANRWGDYSAMRLDPDGCTFWYTQEFYQVTQAFDWSTQIANIKFTGCQNPAYDGYIELCKQTDPDYPVSGPFSFTLTAGPFFSKGPIVVPVGSCSPPIQVPSGIITITEAPQVGVAVENVTAYSYDQFGNYIDELDSWTPPEQTATVTVMPGGVNLETVATFTNYAAPPGALKVCKIAGPGVTVGTLFDFTATGLAPFQVPAGPAPGGSCEIVGTIPINSQVTVTETHIPPGIYVSNITVTCNGCTYTINLPQSSVVTTIGSGFTEVDFTDTNVSSTGSCQPSESLSVLVNNNNVTAYVPHGHWIYQGAQGTTGIGVLNIEGTSITNTLVLTGSDFINSCASNWTTGKTICTANTANAYLLSGTSKYGTFTTSATGTITNFSGGQCTNCGVAMDGVNNRAIIGMSINASDAGGWQLLDLTTLTGPVYPSKSGTSGYISENSSYDPIRNLLLSADESGDYQILTFTPGKPVGFYQNTTFSGSKFDSSAEDCSNGIALAPIEATSGDTQVYVGGLNGVTFQNGMWSPPSQMIQPLAESSLGGGLAGAGPIAVAQGADTGILGSEFYGNSITAFTLYPLGTPVAIKNWVTCNLGNDHNVRFRQGQDPHTVTAYQSPGGFQFPTGDAIAVISNLTPSDTVTEVAIVDLTQMLALPTDGNHGCCPGGSNGCYPNGTLPASVVSFKNVP
jgi:hypothetical protein